MEHTIVLPSQPRVVKEEEFNGLYEIDGLYPGYGHTLGNSLRRIILSSLPGAAITSVKIDGVSHEFSTIEGVKEDVIAILLNLKKVRIKVSTDEPQIISLNISGTKEVTAGDLEIPGQIEILNPELVIATVTDKNATLKAEMTVQQGLGYVSKDDLQKDRVDIGTIALDAVFSPIRRVNYEVEKMRVGDRTDFNRLRLFIETDGTITPREVLERSIAIMIEQLKAIVGFKEEEEPVLDEPTSAPEEESHQDEPDTEFLKTRLESLNLSTRTENALINANIRTVGGLVRKTEDTLLAIEGLGKKGIDEIKSILEEYGITLRKG
jgi:DNA-directed RNA polymerase subunit alpha